MFNFKIIKKSNKSRARLGILETPHGVVETPSLVSVATQAAVKAMINEQVEQAGSQILIANTFHLMLKPGEKIVKENGGLHKFMNWKKPIMTDSGGFQVFSLGFGKDLGVGKIIKHQSEVNEVKYGQQPKLLKINDDGVIFTSYVDGKKIFLGPKESMKIQEALGADIIFAFDECTPPTANYEYTKKSLLITHRWAEICLKAKKSKQALFGIVQGGKFKDLRVASAKFIGNLDFDGFGIGGEFGDNKKIMANMLKCVIDNLPDKKPRHLLGIGHLDDMPVIIKQGIDLFDCTAPTHYARRGVAFTSTGKIDLRKPPYLKDKNPVDKKCSCFVCQNYRRNYISHLFRANEISAMSLLTFHNLYLFNNFVKKIREDIKKGKI